MHCVVTAGGTIEPLDEVRRLTNFSTGRLGTALADYLIATGHRVTLLRAEHACQGGTSSGQVIRSFTTTSDLQEQLLSLTGEAVDAVFHAAAVSDFRFGKVYARKDDGTLQEVRGGKLSTRLGPLLAELVPTPKVIQQLRSIFPTATLVGWKYEVDGGPADIARAAAAQRRACLTDACVMNGPAYGEGFGVLMADRDVVHCPGREELFACLGSLLEARRAGSPNP